MKLVIIKFPHDVPQFFEDVCTMAENLAYDITAVVSLEKNPATTSIKGYPVVPLTKIYDLQWDVAILVDGGNFFDDFVDKMVAWKIGTREQFKNSFWLLKQFMIKKYEDCADPVIQETMKFWQTNDFSVFNQHLDFNVGISDFVFLDDQCNLPYIHFKTVSGDWRKMYYPQDEKFYTYKGKKVLSNLMKEQEPTSPHLYTTAKHDVHAGDIVIDAGVCEGNFALKYVDICSKIYLFEPDQRWYEPLKQTFKDYRDKVEIFPCFVSDITEHNVTRIDDALPNLRGKNIFLKMDVEGSEPDALRGAENLLTNNRVRASICTYHNADDLVRVKSILQRFGFTTSTSDGYMVFVFDRNIYRTADFRKGVVRAVNF